MTRRNALQNDVLKGANRLRNAVAAARGEASRDTLLAELEAMRMCVAQLERELQRALEDRGDIQIVEKVVQVPVVKKVQRMMEVPQIQTVQKMVLLPTATANVASSLLHMNGPCKAMQQA